MTFGPTPTSPAPEFAVGGVVPRGAARRLTAAEAAHALLERPAPALPDPLPPVLTAGQVASFMGYMRKAPRAHQPNRDLIFRLVRAGKFPPPIDEELSTVHWRWNVEVLLAYREGNWTAPKRPAKAKPAKA